MPRYTVVITPDADGAPAGATGQTTIVVETAGPAPRITEMTIRASDPRGLSPLGISGVELEAVVRVLASAMNIETRDIAHLRAAAPAGAGAAPRPRNSGRAPERMYRRMPDREELLALHEELGSVIAVARHYEVPRHTAQGWMGRARKSTS